MKIKDAKARVVLNSRGNPTIEVEINGYHEAAPEGASKGSNEAKYKEPTEAVRLFNEELVDFLKTFEIEDLDDLKAFEESFMSIGGIEKYGANTLIATELAILRAWSNYYKEPVYKFFNKHPSVNIRILANVVGGGAHAKGKSTDIQEFLISPRTEDTRVAIFVASYFHKLIAGKLEVLDKSFLYGRNDEGAWTTSLEDFQVLALMKSTAEDVKMTYDVEIDIGIDYAANNLYKNGYYVYKNGKFLSREEQIEKVIELANFYNLFYIEDPLEENDFEGFSIIRERTSSLIVGDDLTVTNIERIKKALENKSIRGVIIKPNQIGSIVKTYEAVKFCKENGLVPIFSHRSGETESGIIAQIAYGMEVPFVKFGISGGERIAKLNELLRIYENRP